MSSRQSRKKNKEKKMLSDEHGYCYTKSENQCPCEERQKHRDKPASPADQGDNSENMVKQRAISSSGSPGIIPELLNATVTVVGIAAFEVANNHRSASAKGPSPTKSRRWADSGSIILLSHRSHMRRTHHLNLWSMMHQEKKKNICAV
ncbi:hypothetical protein RRG08_035748 [Elysia crispata]|uniref:Uncharacterized protein n=1 Tax=Elysia crispata TaxID=231223 RepID=A0AAE1DIF4_9GAST|nr:hypothetical protein RRG08_035748 [Elysia crispata]